MDIVLNGEKVVGAGALPAFSEASVDKRSLPKVPERFWFKREKGTIEFGLKLHFFELAEFGRIKSCKNRNI